MKGLLFHDVVGDESEGHEIVLNQGVMLTH